MHTDPLQYLSQNAANPFPSFVSLKPGFRKEKDAQKQLNASHVNGLCLLLRFVHFIYKLFP